MTRKTATKVDDGLRQEALVRALLGNDGENMADLYRRIYNRPSLSDRGAQSAARRAIASARSNGTVETVMAQFGLGVDAIAEKLREHMEAWKLDTFRCDTTLMTIPVPDWKAQIAAIGMVLKLMGIDRPKETTPPAGPLSDWSAEELEAVAIEVDGHRVGDRRYCEGSLTPVHDPH